MLKYLSPKTWASGIELYGAAWSCTELYGAALSWMELHWAGWSCLELYGAAWNYTQLQWAASAAAAAKNDRKTLIIYILPYCTIKLIYYCTATLLYYHITNNLQCSVHILCFWRMVDYWYLQPHKVI